MCFGESEEQSVACSLSSFPPVSEDDVRKMILKSSPKSCEFYPMPTSLLLECIDEVVPAVTHVVNESFLSGMFPSMFKTAIVKPLLKKPSLDQDDLKNYRPVSNLSVLSKVAEKNRFVSTLRVSKRQSAFQPSAVCLSSKPQN